MYANNIKRTKQLTPHPSSNNSAEGVSIFDQQPQKLVLTLIILFVLAGAVRLYKLKAPGLLIDREYTSAILSRDFYFEHTNSVEKWRKDIDHIIRQNQPILEPPVTEYLVSLIYRVVGSEQLWYSRFLTSTFWLIGGVFLYKIVKTIVSPEGAIFATAYYLFVPLSILISRSFQPDSLMMMLFLISLFCIVRYYEKPSDIRLMGAASISGVTLLCRPLVLFTLLGTFTALAIAHKGTWKRFIDKRFLIFIATSLLPVALYYGFGIVIAGFLRWKVETSFRPFLLMKQAFWRETINLAINAVGFTPLIGALIGMPMLHKGMPRALVVGLGIGYVIFGLVFTMHIHTHGYYHAQLIPIIAISISPVGTLLLNRLKESSNKWYWWLPAAGVIVLVIFFSFREVRRKIGNPIFESEQTAWEIGEIVSHGSQIVFLSPYYGLPLQYYGELSGAYWPRSITSWFYRRPGERELSIEDRLYELDFIPEYFVITDFNEYDKYHTDLKDFLADKCTPIAESNEYLIYGNCIK